MLSATAAAGFGAIGGLIVEVLAVFGHLITWQTARHEARRKGRRRPSMVRFIDPAADFAVALTRAGLGAATGLILQNQLAGPYAAVAVGAAAPALLATIGKATQPLPAADTTTATADPTPATVDASRNAGGAV
ncbi:hypothetical protein ACFS5L_34350 [Streptomyces phyllanthi]|uniref:Uncharacterized protein n=1 Tax=Streptomyces phyllanthi TaxID=1803180 RepID=A0A5N8W0E8_9ACTN|nr:hypothetical protein [Streptomyces phyllanthi]MPY40552.1 hypothetical protein [Streptomyces phyllanthi]